ncbi:hypothetical protein FHW69_001038 [Luteibacter sp. Sphag1AF]|uniref:DUF2946 domain-containing protein n=1 Tax=Luteibacter sp. Sphag1AF TaxID=2587031 RepID=UPI00160BADD0|nr:DUF2946 domain-containing protein [Luteibacter sp. Sphag1AF]MBB3226448.1 hypothetical protein [Luteibacter sp. Sphag1AF]
MRTRNRPYQRIFVWLAFVAMGLASLMPVVSQLNMAHAMPAAKVMQGIGGMPDMGPDCSGHMAHAIVPAAQAPTHPNQHVAAPLDACGYCSFLAHFAGMPPLPVMVMRPPLPAAETPLAAFSTRARMAPWLLDAAPRGPPNQA